MRTLNAKKYIFVFFITFAIFATALYISSFASNKRIEEIKSIEDKIAVDILSSETQYSLLAESSCSDIGNPSLSEELNSLAEKLSYTEGKLGADNTEVLGLKRYYSLLEIKDYLLMKKVTEKCKTKTQVILYFYSNKGDCTECERMGYVLTFLRNEYPGLRVYAFDYNLDLSAVRTLRSMLKIENKLPAVVINDKTYYGFKSIEDVEEIMPGLKTLKETATSTSATTTKKN